MVDQIAHDRLRLTPGLGPDADLTSDHFARIVKKALRVPVALVTMVESDRQVLRGAIGLPEPWQTVRQTPLSHSFCQYVVRTAAPFVVSDARSDRLVQDNAAIDDLGVVAYAGFPLINEQDKVVGSVCAIDSEPRVWTSDELDLLSEIAALCSSDLQLRGAQRALTRSYARLTVFAGQISHDLKSPLTAVSGFLEMLGDAISDGSADAEVMQRYVGRSAASTSRMLETLDQLLSFAAIGGVLNVTRVSLDDVLPAVLDDMAADVDGAEITWSGVDFDADAVQLRSLLQNLIGNSLAYRSPTRPCAIEVTTTQIVGGIELRIVDNGTGIPREHRGDVLRPLVRLRDDVPGSGLGLATCDRIVTAHHGILQIGATDGGGTTVTVVLPG